MAELMEFKCPCCGGSINFDSASQQMKCPYCDASFDMEALKANDEELANEKTSEMSWERETEDNWREGEQEGMLVYGCESCGGEIVGDANVAATKCPYCDNPVVMKGQFTGELRPDLVIPFKLNKKQAKEALNRHFKGKRFLPRVFKDQNHIDEIKGVYVPFWLFDADVDADVRYKGSKVRTWSDSRYNYTETSYYNIFRAGSMGFDFVPVDGSTKMSDNMMESLEPFDVSGAVDFQTAYLAGYLADKYDVDIDQSIGRANERVKKSTESALAATVTGFSGVSVEHSDVRLQNGKVRYALYPVWMLNTTWNGNKYTFAMNGQTGKFVGDLPLDKGAYWRMFGMLTAIFGVVGFGLQWLLTFFV